MRRAELSSVVDTQRAVRRPGEAGDVTRADVASIAASSVQPRIRFEGIEELAESIITAGGVLQPLLVRRQEDGYELIDGERRLRAVKALLDRQRLPDRTVPIRVLDVPNDAVASALALIANAEREKLSAFEIAQSYQHLKRVLEEAGKPATSRDMAQYVGHEHASIAEYTRVAEIVTDTLMEAAGITTASGGPDRERVNKLGFATLKRVVKAQESARVQALQEACAPAERRPARAPEPGETPRNFEERVRDIAARELASIRWRGPTHDVPVREATRLLHQDILPAAVAVARRASALNDTPTLVAEISEASMVLVCPGPVEMLSARDAADALEALDALRRRIKRAAKLKA
jgi:ParB family chromosome partitioning protein